VQHSVPVDDAQPLCALSGERFEQYWDDAHQEWRYAGARRLDAAEAAR
jgi:pre-mRNA cleavage complex 2 protein Pcf11